MYVCFNQSNVPNPIPGPLMSIIINLHTLTHFLLMY